jgi:hypothetical protein
MDERLYYRDATDLAALIRSKEVSPIEVMRALPSHVKGQEES